MSCDWVFCLHEVSNFMIRLLRHDDTVHREDDGAVRFDDLAELFKSRFACTSQWSIEAWKTFLARGGGPKKRFHFFRTFRVFPSNLVTFRRYSLLSCVARQCTLAERLRRVHPPRRERSRHALHHPRWIDSRRKKSQKGTGSQCFSQP